MQVSWKRRFSEHFLDREKISVISAYIGLYFINYDSSYGFQRSAMKPYGRQYDDYSDYIYGDDDYDDSNDRPKVFFVDTTTWLALL